MQEVIGSTPIFSTKDVNAHKKADQFPGRPFCCVATVSLALHEQAFHREVPLAGIVAEGEDAAALGHVGQLLGDGG